MHTKQRRLFRTSIPPRQPEQATAAASQEDDASLPATSIQNHAAWRDASSPLVPLERASKAVNSGNDEWSGNDVLRAKHSTSIHDGKMISGNEGGLGPLSTGSILEQAMFNPRPRPLSHGGEANNNRNSKERSTTSKIRFHRAWQVRPDHLVKSQQEMTQIVRDEQASATGTTWVCDICARKCTNVDACKRCYNPREKSMAGLEKAKAQKAKVVAHRRSRLTPGQWVCEGCTYTHYVPDRTVCHRCNTARSDEELQDYARDHSGNRTVDEHHKIAGTEKTSIDNKPSPAESWNSRGRWSCSHCGHQNNRQDWVCRECQTSRASIVRVVQVEPIHKEDPLRPWKHLKYRSTEESHGEGEEPLYRTTNNGDNSGHRQDEQEARLRGSAYGRFIGFDKSRTLLPGITSNLSSDPLNDNEFDTRPHNLISTEAKKKLVRRIEARAIGKEQDGVSNEGNTKETVRHIVARAYGFKEDRVSNERDTKGIRGSDQATMDLEEEDPRKARRRARFELGEKANVSRNAGMVFPARDKKRIFARRDSHTAQEDFNHLDEDDGKMSRIERKRQRKKEKLAQNAGLTPTPIILPEFISIGNLATALKVRIDQFVERMRELGFDEMSNDHVLDAETAGLIAAEFNFESMVDQEEIEDLVALPPIEDRSLLLSRPPVVTIMGHVDHGKTTLLDWLRKSSVAASEHGGITQHIGAFTVPMSSGRIITFLDTPGHAAFLKMRQRGANVTDIVILVVAGDDSVKPQTIEAIKHAQAAKVPIIVAITKIDKPDSDIARVKQDLARHGIDVEDFGGETQVVCASGKTGQGMEELEDAAVALADVLDLRAETDGQVEGWVLEATTRKAGRVATVLVRRGTITPGAVVVAGSTWARVRTLHNEAGISIPSAGPGTPVEVDGWRDQPNAGDEVLEAPNERRARAVVELRLSRVETAKLAEDVTAVNESRRAEQEKRALEARAQNSGGDAEEVVKDAEIGMQELPFIIRADVSGSVEAVLNSVSSLGNAEVRPNILRTAVGTVTPFDIEHAAVAKGHIICFNTPISADVRRLAEANGVGLLEQNIIYRLIDDVKGKLEKLLPPLITTRVTGEAEVAQVFEINVKRREMVPVAGCRVRNGLLTKSGKVRIVRKGKVVYDGMAPLSLLFLSHFAGCERRVLTDLC